MHMPKILAATNQEASYDFFSNIIMMDKYEKKHLITFQQAIAWEPGDSVNKTVMDFRALLKHEVTHFLDATTTLWGGQFNFRKLRMLSLAQAGGDEFRNRLNVFALETGELELHTALVEPGKIPPASCDTIHHGLIYTEKFGVCIIIFYFKNTECVHKVPASMRSLLEANATASEFLSLLQSADSIQDAVDQMLTKEDINRRFNILLNDQERLEYSVLLHLTRVHFKELNLCDMLKLVAAIARFSLDLSDMDMAMLADPIEESFENKHLGESLAMELRRASHRQLIFFKTVLFMHGWLVGMKAKEQIVYLNLIRSSPAEAIRSMWTVCFNKNVAKDTDLKEWTVKAQGEWICDLNLLADGKIFRESNGWNRKILKNTSVGLLSFKDLKLMDALLADNTEIVFPNRIDISVLAYFNDNMNILASLDNVYRSMSHERFHIAPGTQKIQLV
ncbi:MAG: hypothetical protein RL682_1626 [Pseudomonadota bacterium]|jgi:hypothetical protein